MKTTIKTCLLFCLTFLHISTVFPLQFFRSHQEKLQKELFDATKRGDIKAMQKALYKGANVNGIVRKQGTSSYCYNNLPPLVLAARNNDTATLCFLLNQPTIDPNIPMSPEIEGHPYRWTALCFASKHGNVHAIRALVAAGAQPASDDIATTELKQAAKYGHAEALKILVQLPEQQERINDVTSTTPLVYATRNHDYQSMQILLKAGADPNRYIPSPADKASKASETSPLVEAAYDFDDEAIKLLIAYQANPTMQTRWGTALQVAAGRSCFSQTCRQQRAFILTMLQKAEEEYEHRTSQQPSTP